MARLIVPGRSSLRGSVNEQSPQRLPVLTAPVQAGERRQLRDADTAVAVLDVADRLRGDTEVFSGLLGQHHPAQAGSAQHRADGLDCRFGCRHRVRPRTWGPTATGAGRSGIDPGRAGAGWCRASAAMAAGSASRTL